MFVKTFSSSEIVKKINASKNLPGPVSIGIALMGGEMRSIKSNKTAFYPRNSNFFVDISSKWDNISDNLIMETWTNIVVKNFLKKSCTYAYVGFPVTFPNIRHTPKIYYGKNFKKLKKIQKHNDTLNILSSTGTLD